jgi:uncharacterized protein YndB with AHSA1/START domain
MNPITVSSTIHAPIHKVWDCWTKAEHIEKWNFASDDWNCPEAKNNLIREGIATENIFVTGNTGIDALFEVRERLFNSSEALKEFEKKFSFLK